jgi:hypothetical protein
LDTVRPSFQRNIFLKFFNCYPQTVMSRF